MNLIKRAGFFWIFGLVSVFMSSFVSAVVRDDFNGVLNGMSNGIRFLFGDVVVSGAEPGEVLFVKLMVFILLFAIINMVLKRIPQFEDQRGVVLIISLVVSAIAVRYMTTENLINFIWLPYGTLGVVLSVLLPFIIGFFFIEGFDSTIIRKVGWTAFIIIFGGLAYMRWNDFSTGGLWWQNLAWMYLAIAVVSGLLLLFDRQISNLFYLSSFSSAENRKKRIEVAKIQRDIDNLYRELAQAYDRRAREAIKKEINAMKKARKELIRS